MRDSHFKACPDFHFIVPCITRELFGVPDIIKSGGYVRPAQLAPQFASRTAECWLVRCSCAPKPAARDSMPIKKYPPKYTQQGVSPKTYMCIHLIIHILGGQVGHVRCLPLRSSSSPDHLCPAKDDRSLPDQDHRSVPDQDDRSTGNPLTYLNLFEFELI